MEIDSVRLEHYVYKSGTQGIVCKVFQGDTKEYTVVYEFNVHVLRGCYQFERSLFLMEDRKLIGTLSGLPMKLSFDSDIVSNPRNIDIWDKQLLKILNPQIDNTTWEIFQLLKDLVDNRVEEEYTLERIKGILQQENKIES